MPLLLTASAAVAAAAVTVAAGPSMLMTRPVVTAGHEALGLMLLSRLATDAKLVERPRQSGVTEWLSSGEEDTCDPPSLLPLLLSSLLVLALLAVLRCLLMAPRMLLWAM
jgi:hypothetical protein